MEYTLIGKYVNTHGIKGEIKIISDTKLKNIIFKADRVIYLGKKKDEYHIKTYRKHKQYDMITLEGINNINDIEHLKGSLVYINKKDFKVDNDLELIQNLEGYKVYDKLKLIGYVTGYMRGEKGANDILIVGNNRLLIPYLDLFIKEVILSKQEIHIKNIRGLIDEN